MPVLTGRNTHELGWPWRAGPCGCEQVRAEVEPVSCCVPDDAFGTPSVLNASWGTCGLPVRVVSGAGVTGVPPLKVVNDAFRTMNVLNASFTTLTHHLAKPSRRNDTHSDHVCPIRPVRIYSRISPQPKPPRTHPHPSVPARNPNHAGSEHAAPWGSGGLGPPGITTKSKPLRRAPARSRTAKTKGTPRTRQSLLILAAFRPWGGSQGGRRAGSVCQCTGRGSGAGRGLGPGSPEGVVEDGEEGVAY